MPPARSNKALWAASGRLTLDTWPTKLGSAVVGIGGVLLLYGTYACTTRHHKLESDWHEQASASRWLRQGFEPPYTR